jgi:hypothetical protein
MAKELQRIVIPALFAHFNSPPMKDRLRTVYSWGYSFEQWFKWETLFALDPIVSKMKGEPWEYDKWEIEKRQRDLGIVDIALLGNSPLFLHLKVFVPWSFNWGWINGRENCLKHDIDMVRGFREAASGTILLVMEHTGKDIDLEQEGLPGPENPDDAPI